MFCGRQERDKRVCPERHGGHALLPSCRPIDGVASGSREWNSLHVSLQQLRTVLEKTASFHGFSGFGECIKREPNDPDGVFHARLINILSHGNYSLYEPREMVEENKEYFRTILNDFKTRFPFNPELFLEELNEA